MESVETSFRLQDRTAVIVGPCTTFVQAIATKLTQMGTNVAMLDKAVDRTQRFANVLMDAREIHDNFGRAAALPINSATAAGASEGISRVAEAFGGIDVFIDASLELQATGFRDAKINDDFETAINANLRAPFFTARAVLKFLENRKRGRVIFLMHDLSRLGLPESTTYSLCRGGVSHFAKALAREVKETQTTVNCVAMGLTEELLLSYSKPGESIQNALKTIQTRYPQAHLIEPERIANMVAFLASPLGAGVTGQTLAVSEGLT